MVEIVPVERFQRHIGGMMRTARTDGDVAVVGASLAGCATATLLARAGARVVLVDKQPRADAYKRLCGHYIQASATPVLRRRGLAEPIEAAGGVRNGVDLWTRWRVISAPEPAGQRAYGYSIRRVKLDPMIRELACGTPGVEYLPGREAVGLQPGGGVVLRDRDGRSERVSARLVVGADGRGSAVARLAGARERRSANGRFCYMGYFSGVGLEPGSGGRFWALDPDVAIAAPNDDGLTLLAVFLSTRRLPEFRDDRAAALRGVFAPLPDGPGLDDATLAGKVVGYVDYASCVAIRRRGRTSRSPATRRSPATPSWRSAAAGRCSRPRGWPTRLRRPSRAARPSR